MAWPALPTGGKVEHESFSHAVQGLIAWAGEMIVTDIHVLTK